MISAKSTIKIKENWLTQKPDANAYVITLMSVAVIMLASFFSIYNIFGAKALMAATVDGALYNREYWRLWTALFAHSDLAHALANLFLFFPFAYFLTGYFGAAFFPFFGFLVGGLVNYFVLLSLPAGTSVIGASGVVHWMGATWITLYLMLETREKRAIRILKAIGASLILFVPSTFKPEISYLSHFYGYVLGIVSGVGFYFLNRKKFLSAIKVQEIIELEDLEAEERRY